MMHNSVLLREFGSEADKVSAMQAQPNEDQIKEAHAQGVEEGLEQARAEIATETLTAIQELTVRLDDLSVFQQKIAAETSAEAGNVLSAVVHGICPALAALGLAERARQLLEETLCDAPRPLTVNAAPEVAERLESLISDISEADYTIEAQPEMPTTQVEIAWPEGGATIDVDALASSIMSLVSQLDPNSQTVQENPHE